MTRKFLLPVMFPFLMLILFGCKEAPVEERSAMQKKVDEFIELELTSDLITGLTTKEKELLPFLFETAQLMDEIYWMQAFGDKSGLLDTIKDKETRKFIEINYGPWERLKNNEPFIEDIGQKPAGANFYPPDMSKEEFSGFESEDKTSLYTLIRRADDGSLQTVPYHIAYKKEITKAAELLKISADLAENDGFKTYLTLRADALLTDEYLESDLAWMDMKINSIDFYVTFMAGIFRSVRFGVASSHGKANMIRFYYFQEEGAFTRDEETNTYRINFDKMKEVMNSLAQEIIVIQGNGDYQAAKTLVKEKGFIREGLQSDLDRISEAGIPRDIRFHQGIEVIGL